ANLVAFPLDRRLGAAAEAAGATYTRYADDLAFSGDRAFERSAHRFAPLVAAIAAQEGFRVNARKTRFARPATRQVLAGVVVNDKPNLRRAELDLLEAILTNCARRGPSTQNRAGVPSFREHLAGRIAWVHAVNPARAAELRTIFEAIDWE